MNKNNNNYHLSFNSKLKESCGIFGIVAHDPGQQVSQIAYQGLMSLQHRGQEAAGISVVSQDKEINTYVNLGLVSEVLTPEELKRHWGNVAISHCRYGTTGSSSSIKNAQPYQFDSNIISFSLGFNGNISNYDELKNMLIKKGRIFTTNSDTEVIAYIIASISMGTNDWVEILKILTEYVDGSYSLVILTNEGDIYAMRDPLGFKPLCYGKLEKNCKYDIVSSESCAIDTVGGNFIDDVKPGEIIHLAPNEKIHSETVISSNIGRKALCMFEFVYFARPDSVIDGKSVALVRQNLGKNIAKEFPVDFNNAVVVPVPDSGRGASVGFAQESGVPYVEGLMKNRYVWRTFITPGQDQRSIKVREKLNPVKSIISGKEVILIDDSIVRGTTTAFIVKLLKQAGAIKVHVRISCPPVREPCYMGVDFPTKGELIAGKMELLHPHEFIDAIREKIDADTLGYQTIDGLVNSIGIHKNKLCLACLNGDYPLKTDPRKKNLEQIFTNQRD